MSLRECLQHTIAALAIGCAAIGQAATAYVSMTGDDGGAVLDDSNHPFGTVATAVAALGEEGGTVSVAAGTYKETAADTCVSITAPIAVIGATGNPDDVTITHNGQRARIFLLNNAEAKLQYLTIYDGKAPTSGSGGNVEIEANGGVIEDCVISGGKVGAAWNDNGNGGNIHAKPCSATRISRCRFLGGTIGYNTSNGASLRADGEILIEDCLFTGATATTSSISNGGTVSLGVSNKKAGMMVNCSIVGNAGKYLTGVYADAAAKVVNCAIFGNTTTHDTSGRGHVWGGSQTSFINCAADVEIAGTGCTAGWPGFANAGDGNYHLTAASVCVGAGTDPSEYGVVSTTDLDGKVIGGDGVFDVGCYVMDRSKFSSDFRVTVSSALTSLESPATATFTASDVAAAGAVTYTWDFGDGSDPLVTSEVSVEHDYSGAGSYTVTLYANDGVSDSSPAAHANAVVLAPFDLYVDKDCVGSAYPYDTAETAAKDIATAYEAASDGSVIHVAAKTYTQTAVVSVMKAVTIRGEGESPADTIIDGNKKCHPFYIQNAGAKLANMTVQNGYIKDNGGCVQIDSLGGTVEDCIFSNGDVSGVYSGKGGALYMAAGRASRCIMTGSKGPGRSDHQGCGPGLYIGGGIAEDCLIYGNTSGDDGVVCVFGTGVLLNCTVVDNSGNKDAGVFVGSDDAKVVNCAIYNNTAKTDTTGHGGVWTTRDKCFYNCAAAVEIPAGTECRVVDDPKFKDRDNHDYRIAGTSELLDCGADRSLYDAVSTTDLSGEPRVVGTVDIGCYENQKNEMEVSIDVADLQAITPASATLVADVKGASGVLSYLWSVTNTVTGGAEVVLPDTATVDWNPAAGSYLVSLRVTAGGTSADATPVRVQIAPRDLYVKPVNDGMVFPFETPETAAIDIQTALDAAVDGCTIHVLPGVDGSAVYEVTSAITITKKLILVGEADSPSDVAIHAKGEVRALYVNSESAFVTGLKLKGASYRYSGGAVCVEGLGGSISNCVIQGNNSNSGQWGACGSGLSGVNAKISHCEFFGTAYAHLGDNGWGGALLNLNRSSIENSLIHDVSAHLGIPSQANPHGCIVHLIASDAVNCTLVNSTVDYESAQAVCAESGSTVQNCVIFGNHFGDDVTAGAAGDLSVFDHCATDGDAAINESCKLITSAAFKDYANGNYTPVAGGALYNAGVTPTGWEKLTDLAGGLRVVGKAIDIGAYEAPAKVGIIIFFR